jgi:hypothetical protein
MLLKMVKKQEPEHKPKKTQRRAKRRDRTWNLNLKPQLS